MSINKENVKDIKLIDKIVDGTQDITFDNTTSGLSAVTLKDAVDEVTALASTPDKVTTLTLVGNTLTYLDELNTLTNIDLSQYLDNTDKFVTSGHVLGGTLILTLNDSTTINIDVQTLLDNTDKFVVSGGVLGNSLVLTLNDTSTVNIDVSTLLDNTDKFVTSGSVSQNTLTLVLNDSSTINIDISGIQNTTVNTSKIQFSLTGPSTPLTAGGVAWNPDEQTLDIALNGATLQVGQEQLILVRNNTGSTIQNGTVLMATGSIGNSTRITVAPHNGQQAYARYVVGIATETILAGANGFATTFGKVRQINTSGSSVGETWTDGTVLYLKPNGNGALTSTDPLKTQVSMPIAFVLNAHASNGTIFVRVLPVDEHGFIPHTQEMINTAIDALVNGAPGILDTLKELADAIGNDGNFATTITNNINTAKQEAIDEAIALSIALG